MKNILVIPHHPETGGIKIRLVELAKAIAHRYTVSLLVWEAARGEYTLRNRIAATVRDLFTRPCQEVRPDGMTACRVPTLHRPLFLAHPFNRRMLEDLVTREHIDTVINGSYYMFSASRRRPYRYIVDLADLPAPGSMADTATRRESARADAVTVVSQGLQDYVRTAYGRHAQVIPNGFSRARMDAVAPAAVNAIRHTYHLEGKCVLGYVGFIGPWVNVELMVNAFRLFKRTVPNAVLLWVGASPRLALLKQRFASDDIMFTGGITRDIEDYFAAIDIGVLPHHVSPFQDMAFHLKVIEHTAARAPVVSTPLAATRALGFPNVLFAPEDPTAWSTALLNAQRMERDPAWPGFCTPYDWEALAGNMATVIEGNPS